MRVATIQIRKGDEAILREAGAAFVDAWRTGASKSDVFTFSSPAQLFSVLSPRRWTLIERPFTVMETRDTITCRAPDGSSSEVVRGNRRSSDCGMLAADDASDFRRNTRIIVIMSNIAVMLR